MSTNHRHLGCEVEFMSFNDDPTPSIGGFDVMNEYYGNMYEINSFHERMRNVGSLVNRLHRYIESINNALKYHNPVFEHPISIYKGVAFTGIHLHVQSDGFIPSSDQLGRSRADFLSRLVVDRIAKYRGLSFRQVMSHHCWGYYRGAAEMGGFSGRPSVSNWKVKNRYKPVLWNRRHRTYELRFIDYDMLLPENKHILVRVLKDVFDFIEKKRTKEDFYSSFDHGLLNRLFERPVNMMGSRVTDLPGVGSIGMFFDELVEYCQSRQIKLLFDYSPISNTVRMTGSAMQRGERTSVDYYITLASERVTVHTNNAAAVNRSQHNQRIALALGIGMVATEGDIAILGEDKCYFADAETAADKISYDGVSISSMRYEYETYHEERPALYRLADLFHSDTEWARSIEDRFLDIDFEEVFE